MTGQRPVLALLPFRTMGGTEDDALVARGLLEDICGELTRFPSLQVVSWMSGLTVADLTDREVGERLGASHVLRGALRRTGDRLRVTATLVEASRGMQLWTERFETQGTDVFALQDDLVARIAATLVARLEETALKESRRKPTESLAAYELSLRGLALLRQGTPESDEEARGLFRRALDLDPHYARAEAGLSLSWFNEWSCRFWDRFQENGQLAYEHAHRALDLDDRDPMLHLVIGRVLLYRREFEQASWYFDRALALCPNDADNLIQLAICETYLGRPEIGIEHAEKAMRLNPHHPNYYYAYAVLPYLAARDFAKALAFAGKVGGAPMVDLPAYAAIAFARLGRMEEAARQFAAYRDEFRKRITYGREPGPGEAVRWFLEVNPYRRRDDLDLLVEGFRLLGDAAAKGVEHAGPPRHGGREAESQAFQRHGNGWLVEYANRQAILPDLKGLGDIHGLLERPGEEIHCLDLADRGAAAYGGDELLDDRARQAVKTRIRALQEDLTEAEDMNDIGRAERLRAELDRLIETLSRALGLGGRNRRIGSLTERARTTVTWRIRYALRRIEAVHEPLGRHLANSLRTGTFCSYRPERPVSWRLAGSSIAPASQAAEGTATPGR